MRKRLFFISLLCMAMGSTLNAADDAKRPLTVQDIHDWQRITHRSVSDNGQWVAVTVERWRGDGDMTGKVADYAGDAKLSIYDAKGREVKSFFPVGGYAFSASSQYAVVLTQETEAAKHQRALAEQNKKAADKKSEGKKKGKGKKDDAKDDAPMDSLRIYTLGADVQLFDSIRNYKLAPAADWLAYQRGRKDSTLLVRSLDGSKSLSFGRVAKYGFAAEAAMLYFLTAEGKKSDSLSLYTLNLATDTVPRLVKQSMGRIDKMTFSADGKQLAFLFSSVKKDKAKNNGMSLWLMNNADAASQPVMLSDSVNSAFTHDWILSDNASLSFSKVGDRLYFGVALADRVADTTQLSSERPEVQVWSWNEPVQYMVQEFNKKRDAQRTYAAVALLPTGKIVQLCDQQFDRVSYAPELAGKYAIVADSKPYSLESMWRGRTRADYFVVDIESGERRAMSTADYTRYQVSASGKYAYGYSECDSIWYTINLETLERFALTSPQSFTAWDEEHDEPDYPSAYGVAAWLPNDEALLLYDRYDIWKVPARGGKLENMTRNGREQKIQYRLLRLDRKTADLAVQPKQLQYLSAFDETTKGSAYYETRFNKPTSPRFLMGGEYQLSALRKAEKSSKVIFTKESFEYAPDLYVADLSAKLKNPLQLTHLVDQQKPFIWGTAELVEWTTYKGVKVQGLLFKPENFDANKKYPMIVNFYEKNSSTLHSYRVPQPHRSTPDYHMYLSNGYVVFNPDIHYVDGHPGESCYDCVMSGIDKVVGMGFVDEKRIGGSGHSWGGYQYGYLATRTNRFAAIEAGAPVVNMFSAYGGVRWGSGRTRSFQYEHQQSRIGASPWEAPELYTENSSLFTMDKVTTPILIMQNDADGHVPWYQGIEFFVALKRLGKPSWMLNYTGEPHWPVKMANRVDFQIRMKQFFDHYLKDEPMPQWMSEGVKAVDQPFELGY